MLNKKLSNERKCFKDIKNISIKISMEAVEHLIKNSLIKIN